MPSLPWRKKQTTSPPPDLEGARLRLRQPTDDDVATRFAIGRHRDVVESYGAVFDPTAPFSRSHAEAAIQFVRDEPYAWVIDAGGYIGHVRFHSYVAPDKRATLAIGIENPAFLNRGYGTEAMMLALAHAFANGLHRVSLRVLAANSRAVAAYLKCGFVEEGREREAALVNGQWQDDIMMGLLDREFAALAK